MSVLQILKGLFTKKSLPFEEFINGTEEILQYRFDDRELIGTGLTHRSAVRTGNSPQPSYERLEFLGDAVLGLIISDQLFADFPKESEGDLTKTKAMMVNESTLAQISRETGLNKYIIMSPEEERAGGRERPSIISDAFESVIGAVYLDGGIEVARDVVLRLLYTRRDAILADSSQRNFKGDLLELIQAKGEGVPRYDVILEDGPDHEKTFHVVVIVSGERVGEGVGLSKKEAEQRAASMALTQLEQKWH